MGGIGDVDFNILTLKNIKPCKRGHAFVDIHPQRFSEREVGTKQVYVETQVHDWAEHIGINPN